MFGNMYEMLLANKSKKKVTNTWHWLFILKTAVSEWSTDRYSLTPFKLHGGGVCVSFYIGRFLYGVFNGLCVILPHTPFSTLISCLSPPALLFLFLPSYHSHSIPLSLKSPYDFLLVPQLLCVLQVKHAYLRFKAKTCIWAETWHFSFWI